MSKGKSYDYKLCFKRCFKSVKDLAISKACKIKYSSNGTVKLYDNYGNEPYNEENLITNRNRLSFCIQNLRLSDKYFISEEKCKSVLNQLKFLKPNNQLLLKNFIERYKKM